jgi:hypothetical protein
MRLNGLCRGIRQSTGAGGDPAPLKFQPYPRRKLDQRLSHPAHRNEIPPEDCKCDAAHISNVPFGNIGQLRYSQRLPRQSFSPLCQAPGEFYARNVSPLE